MPSNNETCQSGHTVDSTRLEPIPHPPLSVPVIDHASSASPFETPRALAPQWSRSQNPSVDLTIRCPEQSPRSLASLATRARPSHESRALRSTRAATQQQGGGATEERSRVPREETGCVECRVTRRGEETGAAPLGCPRASLAPLSLGSVGVGSVSSCSPSGRVSDKAGLSDGSRVWRLP